MDLRIKNLSQKRPIVLLLIFTWGIVVCFVLLGYFRERRSNVELLDSSLYQFNLRVAASYLNGKDITKLKFYNIDNTDTARLTILDLKGNTLYESDKGRVPISNYTIHSEVADAIAQGRGQSFGRYAVNSDIEYFYSAVKVEDIIFRSAIPYNSSISKLLEPEKEFILYIIGITALISIVGITTIKRLRISAETIEAQHNEAIHNQSEMIRIKKQLTNNINHELKTPVSAIHGYLETIINNPDLDISIKDQFIQKSFQQSLRLIDLLKDITEITKMDEASINYQMDSVSLKEVLDEITSGLSMELIKNNIRVNYNIPPDRILQGNRNLIHSIFSNLITNSMLYSGARDIFIFVEDRDESHHYITLYDNGIGVEAKHLPHLFERFYRIDKGRSRKLGGTGLGLAIVKNAINLHGGTIIAKSHQSGGLMFHFTMRKATRIS